MSTPNCAWWISELVREGVNDDTQTLLCTQDPCCSYAQQVENVTLFEQS